MIIRTRAELLEALTVERFAPPPARDAVPAEELEAAARKAWLATLDDPTEEPAS